MSLAVVTGQGSAVVRLEDLQAGEEAQATEQKLPAMPVRDVSLDDVVGRLKGTAASDPRFKVMHAVGGLEAPRLRRPLMTRSVVPPAGSENTSGKNGAAEGLGGGADLVYWVTMIQNSRMENAERQITDSMDFFKKVGASQRESLEKQSEEIAKRDAAAAKAAEVMGCASTWLGVGLVVASVVGAAFTGGASLLMAGAGLALFAADKVTEAATGQSLTDRLLSPLMNSVITPLISGLAEKIAGLLKDMGVSDEISQIVGSVLATVIAVVVVIGVVAATKSAAGAQMLSKLTGPLARALGKIVPRLVKTAASRARGGLSAITSKADKLSSLLGRGTGRIARKMGMKSFDPRVLAIQAQRVGVGFGVLNSGTQAGGSAWMGINEKQISKFQAEIIKLLASKPQVDRAIDELVKYFQKTSNETADLQKTAFDAMEADQHADNFILKSASRLAA